MNDDTGKLDWPPLGDEPAPPRTPTPELAAPPRVDSEAAPELPIPRWFGPVVAVLLSVTLLLTLRLIAVRHAPGPGEAGSAIKTFTRPSAPAAPTAVAPPRTEATAAAPTAAEARALVDTWRKRWKTLDLAGFLDLYSPGFGAQGKDIEAWREEQTRLFKGRDPVTLDLSEVQVTLSSRVAIAQFHQRYRRGRVVENGVKRLYLRREGRELKIFNEEWLPDRAL